MADQGYEFKFRGRPYYYNGEEVSVAELERIVGARRTPNTRIVIRRGTTARPVKGGNIRIADPGNRVLEEIPQSTQKGSIIRSLRELLFGERNAPATPPRAPAPVHAAGPSTPKRSRRQNTSGQRAYFIRAQVASLASVFGDRYGEPLQLTKNLDYLFIPRFPLPRFWNLKETPILIKFPEDYPQVPPNGFYMSRKCHGHAKRDGHLFTRNVYTGEDLSSKGWNWYCVHCHEGWTPGARPLEPMNIWNFVFVIQASLSMGEF